MLTVQICASVKPRTRKHGWHMSRRVQVGNIGKRAIFSERGKLFSVELLHHAEAAELTFSAVEVTVVIFVLSDKTIVTDVIQSLELRDYVDGKRDLRDPRFAFAFVVKVEAGRRCVSNSRLSAEVIVDAYEQVR